MKDYFKRLKTHHGIGAASLLTVLGALAGATNKSVDPLTGFLAGGILSGILFWSMVLISNFKKD